jgi:hypothetical protein
MPRHKSTLCVLQQETVVLLPTLPHGLAQHNFGADTLAFKPQRWMDTAPAGPDGASGGNTNALPDPTPSCVALETGR